MAKTTTADIRFVGKGMSVTDELREHATKSMAEALRVFDVSPTSIEMVLRHEKNKGTKDAATCEVTVAVPRSTIRVSESAPKAENAIDAASARISRQLRKYKTRLIDKNKRDRSSLGRASLAKMSLEELGEVRNKANDALGEGLDDALVREKHIEATAMSADEAIVQCDLLGHDFYLFRDLESDALRVVYRRNDGGYGLIIAD